jgi:hypothetical protein
MTLHKSLALPALTLGLALAGSAAFAQPAMLPFDVVNTNGNQGLDQAELVGAFGNAGLGLMKKDQNGDGSLSRDELRADGEDTAERDEENLNGNQGNAVSELARTEGGQAVATAAREGDWGISALVRQDEGRGGQERAEEGRGRSDDDQERAEEGRGRGDDARNDAGGQGQQGRDRARGGE